MTITRANLESVLIRRTGRLLTAAGLDGTTVNGSNADLNDPIGQALRQRGFVVVNIASVSDSDVNAAESDVDAVLVLAELRALESALGNYDLVDTKGGDVQQDLDDLGQRLEKKIARLQKKLADEFGIGLGTLTGGALSLSFQQTMDTGDDMVSE